MLFIFADTHVRLGGGILQEIQQSRQASAVAMHLHVLVAPSKVKLKLNKTLDENSSLSYGDVRRLLRYGITQCYMPPDTSERSPP